MPEFQQYLIILRDPRRALRGPCQVITRYVVAAINCKDALQVFERERPGRITPKTAVNVQCADCRVIEAASV